MNTGFGLLAAETKDNPEFRIDDLLRRETVD